jgi:hypothetical protein
MRQRHSQVLHRAGSASVVGPGEKPVEQAVPADDAEPVQRHQMPPQLSVRVESLAFVTWRVVDMVDRPIVLWPEYLKDARKGIVPAKDVATPRSLRRLGRAFIGGEDPGQIPVGPGRVQNRELGQAAPEEGSYSEGRITVMVEVGAKRVPHHWNGVEAAGQRGVRSAGRELARYPD